MCRSSRITYLLAALAIIPAPAEAQLYGFPGDVGVIDDGFGTLPPQAPRLPADLPPPEEPPLLVPPPPPPCPLVIRVGRGLQHPAQARVVYGRPSPCS